MPLMVVLGSMIAFGVISLCLVMGTNLWQSLTIIGLSLVLWNGSAMLAARGEKVSLFSQIGVKEYLVSETKSNDGKMKHWIDITLEDGTKIHRIFSLEKVAWMYEGTNKVEKVETK